MSALFVLLPVGVARAEVDPQLTAAVQVASGVSCVDPITALAVDVLGAETTSACPEPSAPSEPTFSPLDPASPAQVESVRVAGTAVGSTAVSIYRDAACAGPDVVTTAVDAVGGWSADFVVGPGTTTSFSATATDAAGDVSSCASGPQFVNEASAPAPEETPAPTTSPQASQPASPPLLIPVPSAPAPVRPDPQPPAPSPAEPRRSHPAPRTVKLSNERTLTRWAHARTRAIVRTRPRYRTEAITRLRHWNEDGAPEIYVALRMRTDSRGRRWVQLRLPMRPNGTVGWVRRSGLGGLHVVHTQLRIDRRTLRATLYRKGKRIWRSDIGVGKASTPTPSGSFWIRDKLRPAKPGTIYGVLACGTSAYSVLSDWPGGGVVGIHGTNEPALIPGRPSHGCVRVRNAAILRLGRLMPLGTAVRIR